MTKEEILAKSREENKNFDYAEFETRKTAQSIGSAAALIVCSAFYALKIFCGLGQDYSLYTIFTVSVCASSVYTYAKTKNKIYLPMTICWTLVALLSAIAGIGQIIKASQTV